MKRVVMAALLALSVSNNVFAESKGGGGGNGAHATIAQVERYVQSNLRDDISSLRSRISSSLKPGSSLSVHDPVIRQILSDLSRMLASEQWFDKLRLQRSTACIENHLDRDASVQFTTTAAGHSIDSICLSLPRLSKYPESDLGKQISALIIHELAHVAGYDENSAVAVQDYVLNVLDAECRMMVGVYDGKGAAIYFNYVSMGSAIVEYTRFFESSNPSGVSRANNLLKTVDFNDDPSDFSIQVDHGSVFLKFVTMNTDGTTTLQNLSWKGLRPTQDASGYQLLAPQESVQGKVVFDGRSLNVGDFAMTSSCMR